MQKVFWDNPYQTVLNTKVKGVNGAEVLFEQTIAYSFSGGQESDVAHINKIQVLNSRKEGVLIYYELPTDHGFKPGDEIEMKIDWARRYKLMRLHFAAEFDLVNIR